MNIYKWFIILIVSLFFGGCASTGKKNAVSLTPEAGAVLNRYIEKGVRFYKQNKYVQAGQEFEKFFSALEVNARIEFDDILDKEIYQEHIVKEYINRLEPKLLDRDKSVNNIFLQGIALYDVKQYKSAIEYFVKVLLLNPMHKEAMEYIQLSNAEMQKIEEAKEIERQEKEAEENKKKIKYYYSDAVKFYENNDLVNANIEFKKVLKIDPDYKKTREYYNKLKEKLHEKAKSHYKDGLIQYSAGDIKRAIELWNKAIEYDPDYREVQKALERAKAKIK